MRLQKYLANCGVASRRKCEEIILEGRVSVNGHIITELGTLVEEHDEVFCDKKRIILNERYVYYMLNKPTGYVTTVEDEKQRNTVIELMKGVKARIYPVGRLDYNTSGLLFFTNDGDLTYGLTHPKHDVYKTYEVKVSGKVSDKSIQMLREGVVIDRRKTYPAKVEIQKQTEKHTWIQISIHEGRNRQIRKMCEAVRYPVVGLKRIAVGDIKVGNLRVGEYRSLTREEVLYLKKIVGLKQ